MISRQQAKGDIIYFCDLTRGSTGVGTTASGLTVGVLKNDSGTLVTGGITYTYSGGFGGRAGSVNVKIDTSHADYSPGDDCTVIYSAGTVDSKSLVGYPIGHFTLDKGLAEPLITADPGNPDYQVGDTAFILFNSRAELLGSPTLRAYADDNTTETASGITLTTKFDSRDKLNCAKVVTATLVGATTGTSTSSTNTTLVKTGAGWTTNQFAGYYVRIVSGLGDGELRKIASNTSDTLTIEGTWGTNPGAADFVISLGTATNYTLVLTGGTVGGLSVNGMVVGKFTINKQTAKKIFQVDSTLNTISAQTLNASTKIDNIHTAFVLDGAVYQLTVNALENAPGGGGGTDWTATEKEQIRSALGINGDKTTAATGGQLQEMDGNLTTILSDIATVNGLVTTVDGVVDGITSTVNTINSNVNTIDGIVDGISSTVGTISSNVTTVNSNVTTTNSNVTSVGNSVTTVNNNVLLVKSKTDLIPAGAIATESFVTSSVNAIPAAVHNYDHSGSDAGLPLYSMRNMLRHVNCKWVMVSNSPTSATLTVYKEDGVTAAYTRAVTLDATTGSITAVGPMVAP